MKKNLKRIICCVCALATLLFCGCNGGQQGEGSIFDGNYKQATFEELESYNTYESATAMESDFFYVARGGKVTFYMEMQSNRAPWDLPDEPADRYTLSDLTFHYAKSVEGDNFSKAIWQGKAKDTLNNVDTEHKVYIAEEKMYNIGMGGIFNFSQNFSNLFLPIDNARFGFTHLSDLKTLIQQYEQDENSQLTLGIYLDDTDSSYNKMKIVWSLATLNSEEKLEIKGTNNGEIVAVLDKSGKIQAYLHDFFYECLYREKGQDNEWGDWKNEMTHKQKETYEHYDGVINPPSELEDWGIELK